MNSIILKGRIRDIKYSHQINGVEYDKADIIVKRPDMKDDIISLRFKKFACPYTEEQEVYLKGNLRSFSQQLGGNKNKVSIYVFTYFDVPMPTENENNETNILEIDGRICKLNPIRTTSNGKQSIQFILANNIIGADKNQKINNYIPVVVWGKLAQEIQKYQVNDVVKVVGQFHSREYKKSLPNGEVEFRIAHEVVALDIIPITENKERAEN